MDGVANSGSKRAPYSALATVESSGSLANRVEGYLPLEAYGALGDGRSVALSGADGSIDWWCVPNLDSPPLFDRLLDERDGGRFSLTPKTPFTVERRYRHNSNVLETTFTTPDGKARLTESMNSGTAGRLPWAELARRIDGLEGNVAFTLHMKPGRRGDTINPYHAKIGRHTTFHVGKVLGLFVHSEGVACEWADEGVIGEVDVAAGERQVVAIVAGRNEPLVAPPITLIDERIDTSDKEWRDWTRQIAYEGPDRERFVRSALALKLLLYSPSGAISAAATTSLPERLGGDKNYDYRYAWIRDAGYTISAFLAAGAHAEAKAAFSWLLTQVAKHGPRVCYTLDGEIVPSVRELRQSGYRNSRPVQVGNAATDQMQHGVFGEIFSTAASFVGAGHILDIASAELLSRLADKCADSWRLPDSGIWELEEQQHYTQSKINCWHALSCAVDMADQGQLPTTCRARWARERDRIANWIGESCWSDTRGAFVMYPGSDKIDASVALAVRLGFDERERLISTLEVIDKELGSGPFHYRYSGAEKEEGCFLACSFWMVQAYALIGDREGARRRFDVLMQSLERGVGVLSEMVDPESSAYLGNMPQGLTHLSLIGALTALGNLEKDSVNPDCSG